MYPVRTCLLLTSTLMLVRAGYPDSDCPTDHVLNDEERLHKDLFCSYDSDHRPVKDHKTAINVKIRLALKYLSFDQTEETITVHSWVAMNWKDEYLYWDPAQYGGLTETQIESHKIWTPRLALFNADATAFNDDVFFTICLVSSEGTVSCVPHLAHYAICQASTKYWPYDTQNCDLLFGSWMHSGEQVNFTFFKSQPVIVDEFKNGPGWSLLRIQHLRLPLSYSNSSYPILKYTFALQRVAAGPAAMVVVPSVIIVLLTWSSLFLDVKDYTRLFVVCFSLYGHFTFLTEIGSNIPKHSVDTPVILLFVRDSLVITLVAILLTLVLMKIRKRTVAPPGWLTAVTRRLFSGPAHYIIFTDFEPAEHKPLTDNIDEQASTQLSTTAMDWIQVVNFINSFVLIVISIVYFILIFCYIPYGKVKVSNAIMNV